MKKLFTRVAIAIVGFSGVATAQQDPQFTQWMHNKLAYNAGYAGTGGGICGVLQFRQQWVNFDGAPQSIALGADMRLKSIPMGVGLNIVNDKIGPMNTLFIKAAGAWNRDIGKGTLGLGLDVGILQKSIKQDWITPEDGKVDVHIPGSYNSGFATNPDLNKLTYDLGFGAFYQIPGQFYVGLSSTHLPAQKVGSGDIKYDMTRHYYVMAGYTYKFGWSKLMPNVKYKSDLASTAVDVNLTYMWSDMVWVGATYRLSDAAALLIGYQSKPTGKNALTWRIGYSYDYTLSKIKGYTSGTHEIIAGVCMTLKVKKITTYGDPRFLN
ncbi:MAG: type IX secretion system membrane protein PorP/SprF [Bacteroidota bacterium]|nr:type IX secretion system membrane protein PorP/SprF [Bacteroidota bacterium]